MSTSPTQTSGLDITEVDDGLVVFHPDRRRVHHLNVTAALVFELCTGANTVERIVELVAAAFALDDQPDSEVRTIIDSFIAEGLVS